MNCCCHKICMNGNIKKSNLVRRMFIIQIILFPNLYNYDLDYLDFETKSMYLTERPPYHEKIRLTWNPKIEFYEMEVLQE